MLEENSIFAARYKIVRRLASGGMGAVYEARHVETGRPCALKVMLTHVAENSPSRERFRLEARAAALVSSAHVVEVLDAGVDDATSSPFLVMELLRGEDLASRMSRVGPLPASDVAKFIFQAARGLDALHRAAIVHRDLKPSNLFLAKRDDTEIIKVLDLGVAKRVVDTAVTTAVVGTPLYMAPEQMSNRKITPATDEYALAMVAYSLLVGREYWAAEAETAASSIGFALLALEGPKEAATERANKVGVTLPASFDAWFRRATALDPEKRFPEILDAALNLASVLGVDSPSWRGEIEGASRSTVEEAPRSLPPDAFAPTLANEKPVKAHSKTLTLGDDAPEARAQTMGLATTEPDPQLEKRHQRRRRLLGAGAISLLGLLVAGFLFFRNRPRNEVIVSPPVIQGLLCPAAEITGPGASPHLADALGKGACARLGIELGVSWLDPKGIPLEVQAETRDDHSAHVVLKIAEQKAEGDGKTLIRATNEAIGKLAPLLKVPPMTPERIAGWGARDAASALRIERAMRQKAFLLADRETLAKQLVATDGDSPMSHAMLACSAKNSDHELAIREKKEALSRLSQLPPKRARVIEANLMDFIPTPEDPKGHPTLVGTYSELGKDPDFPTLYTMCGCLLSGVTLPMADWFSKNAPVMGAPILPCTIGTKEADGERLKSYMTWMKSTLPEMQRDHVRTYVHLGMLDMAREAQELLEWWDTESTSNLDFVTTKMHLAYASFDSKKAVNITEASFGEPDAETASERAIQYVRALIFAGKIRSGLEVGEQQINLFSRAEKYELLAGFAAEQLRWRRLLNRQDLFHSETLERIEQVRAKLPLKQRDDLEVELTLLQTHGTKDKKSRDLIQGQLDTLDKLDNWREFTLATEFPLVRYLRGDEAGAALYRELTSPWPQRVTGFEAGLALEASGDKAGAEKAYRTCLQEPWSLPFESIAARLRLAEITRADGRTAEARDLMAVVDRAWVDADSDLRDIVKRMK